MSLLYGNSLKSNTVCVIVPDEDNAKAWAKAHNVEYNFAEICKNAEFNAELKAAVLQIATEHKLNSLEKPKEIFLYPEPFSVENDILTPTFKLKRNVAAKFFEE